MTQPPGAAGARTGPSLGTLTLDLWPSELEPTSLLFIHHPASVLCYESKGRSGLQWRLRGTETAPPRAPCPPEGRQQVPEGKRSRTLEQRPALAAQLLLPEPHCPPCSLPVGSTWEQARPWTPPHRQACTLLVSGAPRAGRGVAWVWKDPRQARGSQPDCSLLGPRLLVSGRKAWAR